MNPPNPKEHVKGAIGVAERVHYLDQVKYASSWATSACGKWAGLVRFVPFVARVTCAYCIKVERDKKLAPTVFLEAAHGNA